MLQQLEHQGLLVKLGRGLYALATGQLGEHVTLAVVSRRVPQGVLCLLSALRFHAMTTESPHEVWLAINRSAHRPVIDGVSLRIVQCRLADYEGHVEHHVVDNVPITVTTPARTVADCFRYRSKVGLDVALAALRAYMVDKKGTIDELWQAATACRVATVLRPYLEAIV